jgi:hypothetical protein
MGLLVLFLPMVESSRRLTGGHSLPLQARVAATRTSVFLAASAKGLVAGVSGAQLVVRGSYAAARLLPGTILSCLDRQHRVPICRHFERRERRDSNPRPPA